MRNHEKRRLKQNSSGSDTDEYDDIVVYKSPKSKNGWYTNMILTVLAIIITIGVSSYIIGGSGSPTTPEVTADAINIEPNFSGAALPAATTEAPNTDTGNPETVLPSELKLDINPMTLTSFAKSSGKPVLPGTYFINKAYNMMSGKQPYEQSGVDIIDFTFIDSAGNKRYTQSISDAIYQIPFEFRSVPNVVPSCDIMTEVSNTVYSSSTNTLEQQASRSSISGDWRFTVEGSGKKAGDKKETEKTDENEEKTTKTETENETGGKGSGELRIGFHFGHSRASTNGRKQSADGFTYSFESRSSSTFYRADIDWNGYDGDFQWKQPFLDAIDELNDYPSNKNILRFFNQWGTHVLSKMETGSFCTQTTYASKDSTIDEVNEFKQSDWTNMIEVLNVKWEQGGSSQRTRSGNYVLFIRIIID